MGTQLVSHGIPTIETLNKNSGIWIPTTSAIIRKLNTNHVRASDHHVGKGTSVGAAVGAYKGRNNKTDFEITHNNSKFQSESKNIQLIRTPLLFALIKFKNT